MKNLTTLLAGSSFCVLFLIYSCEDKDVNAEDNSSFGLIQSRIFDTSCAISGCHSSESDVSCPQHKLVLAKGFAYKNLVNVPCENAQAHADGLNRVTPGNSKNSLLYYKLHCNDGGYEAKYGNMMPLGLEPLSKGQIEFITAWIDEGAPREGLIDADPALLDDNVPACKEDFHHLDAPPENEGYQVLVKTFEIPSQFEREIFVYKEVGNAEEFYLKKIEMKMRRNSHHFLVNTFDSKMPPSMVPSVNAIRDLRKENGALVGATTSQMEYQIPTIASQTPELTYTFPPGVGLKIPARHKLDVNLHYVNKSNQPILGECSINLYKAAPGEVVHEAVSIFLSHENITLPPRQKSVLIREFIAGQDMKIFMLTSHTHKHGERFEIQVKGGEKNGDLVYTSTDWHHPAIKSFDTPLEIKKGEGLRMIVTYNNTSDETIRFGLTSEDEMAIIYGYYY